MKRRLWERDWLWTFEPSRWKSKKSDWLDLDQAVARETTRFGEKKFHIRNLGDFRKLRREKRFDRAEKKFKELWDDENSVIGYATGPGDFLRGPKKPKITREEALDLLGTSGRLEYDVLRLLDALSGSTGDINALWRVIETAGLIGRFMGEHPHQRNLRTEEGRGAISAKVQRRRVIVGPLILAEAKINPKAVSKRILEKANERLIANGEKPVGKRTFDELVSQIIAEDKAAK